MMITHGLLMSFGMVEKGDDSFTIQRVQLLKDQWFLVCDLAAISRYHVLIKRFLPLAVTGRRSVLGSKQKK